MRRTCAVAIVLGALTTAWLTAEPATPRAANYQPVVAQGRGQGQGRGRGGPARPRTRKAVLAWADTRNGIAQHDSTSHALSVIERLGYESGAYDTFIRTDSNIVANQPQMTTGAPASGGPNLTNVDAVFFLGHREIALEPPQRADLVAFVRDGGKGFVAAHTALTAFDSWPEFGDLLGARYDDHPWNTASGTIINEDPSFPATKHFPEVFAFTDEFYQPKAFSRDKLRVLLRLDVSKKPYAIPADNPFRGNKNGWKEEVWAYGLRNPWRFSFDRGSGKLWAGDVGQVTWEEIDVVEGGKNYGWDCREGMQAYEPARERSSACDGASGFVDPVWAYGRGEGISVTGGYVYRGKALADLVGWYVYADYGTGRVWALRVDDGEPTNRLLVDTDLMISSFGVDESDELYICAHDFRGEPTKIYKLVTE